MKKFRLLKDLPSVKAGAIFTERDCKGTIWLNNYYENDPDYGLLFQKDVVETNPDWFEKIKEYE